MAKRWWWPFGGSSEEEEAESQFIEMLKEASVRTDDLKHAAEELRAERMRRVKAAKDSRRPQPPRPKLHTPTGIAQ